jgi:hypothetical protein
MRTGMINIMDLKPICCETCTYAIVKELLFCTAFKGSVCGNGLDIYPFWKTIVEFIEEEEMKI